MTKKDVQNIMREARLMRYFSHPNVVALYGIAATQEPLMIVMELVRHLVLIKGYSNPWQAANGALDTYLKTNTVDMPKKLEMCLQAAWGIEYIHKKMCLHRDIAARNCLYGEDKVALTDSYVV